MSFSESYTKYFLDKFSITEGKKCSNAIDLVARSLADAKNECRGTSGCKAFFSVCGNSQQYKYCTTPVDTVEDNCGSVLYNKGTVKVR